MATSLVAAEPAKSESTKGTAEVDYLKQIKPIFRKNCFACHGVLQQKSGLRTDTAASIRKGGVAGAAIEPGKSGDSLLIDMVTGADGAIKMPPPDQGASLSNKDIDLLRAWIDQGAKAPSDEKPEPDPRDHWAFQIVKQPPVPAPRHAEWRQNPIDAFIAVEQEKRSLVPTGLADKPTLLRRVTLDLTGLPPTPAELHAFQLDQSADAYEKVVDRLLATPAYGERWGRHWMDVWRYADWHGRRPLTDVWNSAPQIWRWRDWIVRSLNEDKGYDRMLREMIAADEVAPGDDENVVATGYLVRNWYALNPNVWMRDIVEHSGKAFLGLTFNCAHCHDHKYDPIAQEDYFRLRAFFEPIDARQDRVRGGEDPGPFEKYSYLVARKFERRGLVRVVDEHLDAKTWFYTQGDERNRVAGKPPVMPGVPRFLGGKPIKVTPIDLPQTVWYPSLLDFNREALRQESAAAVVSAEKEFEKLVRAVAEASQKRLALKSEEPKSSTTKSTDSKKPATLSPAESFADLTNRLRLAEAKLAAARAAQQSVNARLDADKVAYLKGDGNPQELTEAAVRLDRTAQVTVGEQTVLEKEVDLLAARKKLDTANEKTKPAAMRGLTRAEEALTKARRELEEARTQLTADVKGAKYRPLGPTYPTKSTGRRKALAEWLTNRQNPLVSRVAVNHIWLRHFGKGLVESVYEFGRNGKPTSHLDLHNWLAAELMDHGWSMKYLHRLIVTSRTYRLRTFGDSSSQSNLAADPENRYLTAYPRRRLEAEAIRDSLLASAGNLDRTMGGQELESEAEFETTRRSIYYTCHPEGDGHLKLLETFDAPSPSDCYRRVESLVPQQALTLTNGKLVIRQSRLLAGKIWQRLKSQHPAGKTASNSARTAAIDPRMTPFIEAAFEEVLARPPTKAEQDACHQFLQAQIALYQSTPAAKPAAPTPANPDTTKAVAASSSSTKSDTAKSETKSDPTIPPPATDPQLRAAESLVRSLFNHNDFLTVY